jgi:hypothetical protein
MSNISIQGSGGGGGARTVLTGNATYYVNSATGNDSNPGTALLPFATLQYAWDHLSSTLDGGGFNLTINCAGAGPYTGNFANSWVGFGSVIILGAGSATTSYQNMYFSANPLGAIIFLDSCNLTANLGAASQDWCVQNSGSGYVLVGLITNDYLVTCGDGVVIAFGATSPGAQIGLFGSTTVSGDFTNILSVSNGGFIFNVGTHTISGSPQCHDGFVNASTIGCIKDSGSWTGSLHTGAQPFVVGSNGSIQVTNANPTFYPGDQPGIILDPTGSYVGINEDEVLPRQNVAVPTTGGTVNMALLTPNQILNPASTLATLTVNLPPITNIPEGPWAIDNVIAVISNMSAHTITALTVGVTDASTLVGAPTTLPPNSGFAMQYDKTTTTWSPWVIGAGSSPGGSTGDIQYRTSGGAFGGDPDFTTDGAGHVTLVTLNSIPIEIPSGDPFQSSIAIGLNALSSSSTSYSNTAVGWNALAGSMSSGAVGNCAVGAGALQSVTSGANNVAVGNSALGAVNSGANNIALGTNAGQVLTSGSNNFALGTDALKALVSTSHNTAIGSAALIAATGGENTAIGSNALGDVVGGTDNTAVGYNTGRGIVSGNNNTIIGTNVSGLGSALTGAIIIATGDGTIWLDYDYNNALAWTFASPIIPPHYTVAGLPTPIAGMRATVTDSTVALSGAATGSAPIGTGTHTVPVFANETPAWVIG